MIRDFIATDIENIEVKHPEDRDILRNFMTSLETYEGKTLQKGATIKAIMFYRNYAEQNYDGFIVCSKYLTAFDSRDIKRFMETLKAEKGIRRIETLSLDIPTINKWHEFLGMTCEGVKKRFLNGKDYRMWSILYDKGVM